MGFKKVKYFLLLFKTQYIGVSFGAPQDIVLYEGFSLRDDDFGGDKTAVRRP